VPIDVEPSRAPRGFVFVLNARRANMIAAMGMWLPRVTFDPEQTGWPP